MTQTMETPGMIRDPETAPEVMHVNASAEPPRRGRGRPPGSTNRPKDGATPKAPQTRTLPDMPRARGKKNYATGIEGALLIVGKLVGDIVNPTDGALISAHAKDIAEGWNTLANENAAVGKFFDSFNGTSAWGAALMPTMSLAIAVAANHGQLGKLGSLFGSAPSGGIPSEDATASSHSPG